MVGSFRDPTQVGVSYVHLLLFYNLRMWTYASLGTMKNSEANIDKPATVTPLSVNGSLFLKALHFQNPSKLQQMLVLYNR
jgi:hypothetical protein